MHKSAKESSSARRMKKLNGKSSWFRKDTTNDETENDFLLEGQMGRQRKGPIEGGIDETIRWKQKEKTPHGQGVKGPADQTIPAGWKENGAKKKVLRTTSVNFVKHT